MDGSKQILAHAKKTNNPRLRRYVLKPEHLQDQSNMATKEALNNPTNTSLKLQTPNLTSRGQELVNKILKEGSTLK